MTRRLAVDNSSRADVEEDLRKTKQRTKLHRTWCDDEKSGRRDDNIYTVLRYLYSPII